MYSFTQSLKFVCTGGACPFSTGKNLFLYILCVGIIMRIK